MSFPKLHRTETVINSTWAVVFWRAVPNVVLVLVTFELVCKLLFACDCSIPDSAVKIVRFPRIRFFKIILLYYLQNSATIL